MHERAAHAGQLACRSPGRSIGASAHPAARDYFSPAITQKPVGCVSMRRHRTPPPTLRPSHDPHSHLPCFEPPHHHQGRLAADACCHHLLFFRLLRPLHYQFCQASVAGRANLERHSRRVGASLFVIAGALISGGGVTRCGGAACGRVSERGGSICWRRLPASGMVWA